MLNVTWLSSFIGNFTNVPRRQRSSWVTGLSRMIFHKVNPLCVTSAQVRTRSPQGLLVSLFWSLTQTSSCAKNVLCFPSAANTDKFFENILPSRCFFSRRLILTGGISGCLVLLAAGFRPLELRLLADETPSCRWPWRQRGQCPVHWLCTHARISSPSPPCCCVSSQVCCDQVPPAR